MSANEFAAALPVLGRVLRLLGRVLGRIFRFIIFLRDYLRAVGWTMAAMAVLYAADLLGMATILPFAITNHQPEWVNLLLSVNVYTLGSIRERLSWEMYFVLATFRMMISDPLHYWFGQKTGQFIASRSSKTRFSKWRSSKTAARISKSRIINWCRRKLATKSKLVILIAVFVVTVIQIPRPISYFFAPANPFVHAGIAGIRLRTVMLVDLAASLTFLVLFYYYGADFIAHIKGIVS